jgi:two-component system, NtrC family, response regulator AtoC
MEGKLREDLLYRLNVFPIRLPPLRERKDDLLLLAEHFLAEICASEGQQKRFTPSAHVQILAYHWPGNVRELRNVVQRAYVMANGVSVGGEWLGIDTACEDRPTTPLMTVRIGTSLADAERAFIMATLDQYEGHKERSAAQLGVSLKTLYNRLKGYAAEPTPSCREREAAHVPH